MVGQLVFPQRRDRPGGNPNQSGECDCRNREFNGLREENGDGLGHGHPAFDGGGRVSPVSAQQSLHVVEVLDGDGVPQMELLHDRLEEWVVDVARAELWRAIDGDREVGTERVAQCERDDRHAEQRWDEDEKPANDVEDQAHCRSDHVRERDLKDFSRSVRTPDGRTGRPNPIDSHVSCPPQRSLYHGGVSKGGGTPRAETRPRNATAAIRARTFDRRTVREPPERATLLSRQRRTAPQSTRGTRPGTQSSWSYSAS